LDVVLLFTTSQSAKASGVSKRWFYIQNTYAKRILPWNLS